MACTDASEEGGGACESVGLSPKRKALLDDLLAQWLSGPTKSAWWSVALEETGSAVAAVRIVFRPTQMPDTVTLEISSKSGSSPSWTSTVCMSGKAIREQTILELPDPATVAQARLKHGHFLPPAPLSSPLRCRSGSSSRDATHRWAPGATPRGPRKRAAVGRGDHQLRGRGPSIRREAWPRHA